MVSTNGNEPKRQLRDQLRQAAEQNYDKLEAALIDALNADKPRRVECKCGRKFDVTFPDHSARIRALEIWVEQGFGKPGQATAPPTDHGELELGKITNMADLALSRLAAGQG